MKNNLKEQIRSLVMSIRAVPELDVEKAVEELESLIKEREFEVLDKVLEKYAIEHKKWAKRNKQEPDTPRTIFHVIIEKLKQSLKE